MKKILVLLMALILCVMSVFVGCSSKEEGDKKDTTAETAADVENSALVAFAQETQKTMDTMSVDGVTIKCAAHGNSLVFTYTYDMELDEADAQASLDGLDSTYNTMLTSVKTVVPDCESVIIEILDQDGNILADKEYK